MELEMLAKKKANETKSMVESGNEFYDSELEPEEMAGELDRLIGLERNQMEEVSLDDALSELS